MRDFVKCCCWFGPCMTTYVAVTCTISVMIGFEAIRTKSFILFGACIGLLVLGTLTGLVTTPTILLRSRIFHKTCEIYIGDRASKQQESMLEQLMTVNKVRYYAVTDKSWFQRTLCLDEKCLGDPALDTVVLLTDIGVSSVAADLQTKGLLRPLAYEKWVLYHGIWFKYLTVIDLSGLRP